MPARTQRPLLPKFLLAMFVGLGFLYAVLLIPDSPPPIPEIAESGTFRVGSRCLLASAGA